MKIPFYIRVKISRLALRFACWVGGGISITLKATDWKTTKDVSLTIFINFNPLQEQLMIDWQKRKINKEKKS